MKQVLILIIVFASTALSAQFGVRLKYNSNNYSDWADRLAEVDAEEPFASTWEVGIDYWFRLKNKRIEFYPELAYTQSSTDQPNISGQEMSMNSYMFNVNVNLYPLDFTGDCDCPTFSKQGPGLQKGFFIFISPGIAYDSYEFAGGTLGATNFNYRIGGGLGLDIGINDLVTITPFVGYNYTFNKSWETFDCGLSEINSNCSEHKDTSLGQIQAGLRIGFRPDYKGF